MVAERSHSLVEDRAKGQNSLRIVEAKGSNPLSRTGTEGFNSLIMGRRQRIKAPRQGWDQKRTKEGGFINILPNGNNLDLKVRCMRRA